MGEFDLIAKYFNRRPEQGIGDDCAVFTPTAGMQLCISSDMLVEGRHFFPDVNPEALGHKALAVNLSDLAACGAAPRAFTLALALPEVNEAWLDGFSRGLFALADVHGCTLVGGDTTKGPLNICITVFGEVPTGKALLRNGAKVGDDMYVSGTDVDHVGQARLALEIMRGNVKANAAELESVRHRLERPTPRVNLGVALRGVATSCIDISDGLLGDLGHILKASNVGASVQTDWIKGRTDFALAGGDDYELLFTAPPSQRDALQAISDKACIRVTRIGAIEAPHEWRLLDAAGLPLENTFTSFDHFTST
ncbi:MAG: thiamine-phosphate kinase [Cytophagales bacterium]|nr:thiamine-phosphate kinase [Cytophagales bacterium]